MEELEEAESLLLSVFSARWRKSEETATLLCFVCLLFIFPAEEAAATSAAKAPSSVSSDDVSEFDDAAAAAAAAAVAADAGMTNGVSSKSAT